MLSVSLLKNSISIYNPPLMKNIKLVCFDLDDTLWPCMPTIYHAEDVYYQWLKTNRSRITDTYSLDQLREKRRLLRERTPELVHDISALRIHSLHELAEELDYSKEWIEDAFDAFYQARQQVNFFDDVAPVLEKLKPNYQIAAVTNGNADIYTTELSGYFDYAVSAADAGISKPDPAIFELLQKISGIPASAIVHVGDHQTDDIEGAKRAGIQNIWLNRHNEDWSKQEIEPDHTIQTLYEILPYFELGNL